MNPATARAASCASSTRTKQWSPAAGCGAPPPRPRSRRPRARAWCASRTARRQPPRHSTRSTSARCTARTRKPKPSGAPFLERSKHTRSSQCVAVTQLFDLQAHSNSSDGTLPPSAVVSAAAAAGIELLALSDHDTVDGVAGGARARAGRTASRSSPRPSSARSTASRRTSTSSATGSTTRTPRCATDARRLPRGPRAPDRRDGAAACASDGWSLDEAVLERRRAEGKPLGRPHLAQAAFGARGERRTDRARGRSRRSPTCSSPT